jgi:hypothetical protein
VSTFTSPTTLAQALVSATTFIGDAVVNKPWAPINPEQKHFIETIFPDYVTELAKISGLEGRADHDVEAINAWLRERGFDIELDPSKDPDDFAVAAISDITVEWQDEAKVTSLSLQDDYPAFIVGSGVKLYSISDRFAPLIQIATKSGDIVYIREESAPRDWAELLADVALVRASRRDRRAPFERVVLPMVSAKHQPDVSWLCGLRLGQRYISQAVQEVRFAMNEHGARAKEATAAMVSKGMSAPPPTYEVNRDFLIYIIRPGVAVPIFQAYITRDDWKNPGDLSNL